METKKKADSAPSEGCALGGRLVGLMEGPAMVTHESVLNSTYSLNWVTDNKHAARLKIH